MTRTKIVCTIGPASRDPEMLQELIRAGMDVARLNFSHGGQEVHAKNISRIRAAAAALGRPVAILMDLQGPKLRIGNVQDGEVLIQQGELITLTTEKITGYRTDDDVPVAMIPVQYEHLPQDVTVGEPVLIDDGMIELVVEGCSDTEVSCRVVTGGAIRDHKGLNIPGTGLSIPSITEKDWEDLEFAIAHGADWIALSFVRSPAEVHELQAAIAEKQHDGDSLRVIAKIEKPQALNCIEEIVEAADGIMVARGDLGIEVPAEKVPVIQKRLIRLANARGKPVITATQMLDSMIRNPRPTRAEASDVANAILDGTDAIMLSGETAVGQYPLQAVRTMERIAEQTEAFMLGQEWHTPNHIPEAEVDVTDAVSHATAETAHDLRVAAIIAATSSGKTALTLSKYRPHTKLIAVTPSSVVQRQLMLSWGVVPLLSPRAYSTDHILQHAIAVAHESGEVSYGARVVLTAGVTPNMPGTTNLMTVELVRPQGGSYARQRNEKGGQQPPKESGKDDTAT
jgi:pyruvate kinase